MRYGIIPAGGLGTRSGLTTAKELALVDHIPVIEYILSRLVSAGITQIFVTLTADKPELIDYLTHQSPRKAYIHLIIGKRRGLFYGIIEPAAQFERGDELYFGLPDTVWFPENGFQVLSALSEPLALGLLPSDTPECFGSVTIRDKRIVSIVEKPKTPDSRWIWAFGKIRVSCIPELVRLSHVQPAFTDILGAYALSHPVGYYIFESGVYIDTGTPQGLEQANQYVSQN